MGALMISMDCHHPDLEQFIDIKNDLNKVTQANISIRFTDDFMQAVVDNKNFELSFTRPETGETISKTVNARDIFKKLSDSNWDMGEPGCLFWDRITDYNLLANTEEFEYAGTNPCAEEPLPAGGSCLLGSINLAEFVNNPFATNASFNYEGFEKTVEGSIIALNEVLDEGLPLHPLKEQRDSVRDWRQIGLGVMGISDMLIKLGIRYGSPESIAICDKIGHLMAKVSILTSCKLAEKYGAFPKCNMEEIAGTQFFADHMTDAYGYQYTVAEGLRNSQLLTIAPTGTLSTMLGISGGIEPIFANSYNRTTKSLHGEDVVYKVYTPIVQQYMDANNINNEEDLPDFFVTAQNIHYTDRIAMQSVWQKHIDASISSTVNLPNSATKEDVFNLYIEAWKAGLKGITIFRDGCSRTAILNTKEESKQEEIKCISNTFDLPRGYVVEVSDDLIGYKRKLNTGCGSMHFEVYYDEITGEPQETFINVGSGGGCERNYQFISRLISLALRAGVPIEAIIDQAMSIRPCNAYVNRTKAKGDTSQGTSCPSAIGYALKDLKNKIADLTFDESTIVNEVKGKPVYENTAKCPECGEGIVFESGCNVCKACGWSKCS